MKAECPTCNKKTELKLSERDMLFTLQDCVVCKLSFTQIIRNLKIEDGKITGEIIGAEEMCGANLNKGESDHG